MRRFVFILIAIIASLTGDAQNYSIASIPPDLMKDVNVVKRAESLVFEITENNKARYKYKVAYTILNEAGDRWGTYYEGYDKLRSIESFDATLYDFLGEKVKSLKKADIKDISGSSDGLADDNRIKFHSFYHKGYPYTVEYEVELKYKGTMFLPDWMPQERPVMSVQQSKLVVKSPASNPLHYKMFNYTGEPVITEDKSDKIYTWEVKNLKGQTDEYAAPNWQERTTTVNLATEKFVLDDYQGSNATWKDFGRFANDLKKDRDQLPEDIRQKVHQLTDNVTDVNEKIRLLYKFMQNNTRYVSIQLGVGGWQPFDAKYVASKKYGDCKALSNYMYALLKEANIRSVYTLIRSGNDDNYLMKDLPSSQFNHAILFVPLEKDTTWLECTSQTVAAGYLGRSTNNRYALAVDENGGTLVRTPKYSMDDNLQVRIVNARIDNSGNLEASIKTKYQAVQQDRLHYFVNGLSKDKLMEFLKEDIELPSYDVLAFDYKLEEKKLPVINESLTLVANNYANVTGKRIFITPNVLSRNTRRLTPNDNRMYDVDLGLEYKDVDSICFNLPSGYGPEAMPADVNIKSKFGNYHCSVKLDGDKLYYYRSIEQFSGRFPASTYKDLVAYNESIYKADRAKVVLVKKE